MLVHTNSLEKSNRHNNEHWYLFKKYIEGTSIYSSQLQASLPVSVNITFLLRSDCLYWVQGLGRAHQPCIVPQTVQPAPQQTTHIITTLDSHKPATPEQFLHFQLIKISEFPQPSVNTMCMGRSFSPVGCLRASLQSSSSVWLPQP